MTSVGFQLAGGGGFDRLERALHLPTQLAAPLFAGLTWLPLLALVALDPRTELRELWPDLSVHVRCLVSIPLLLAVEPVIAARVSETLDHLTERLSPEGVERLRRLSARSSRLASLWWIDVLLLAVIALTAVRVMQRPIDVPLYWDRNRTTLALSPAGVWYYWFVLPVFRFLALRWAWRVFLWTLMLVGIARLPIALRGAHPDHSGGLHFLGEAQIVFTPIAFAFSTVVASTWGTNVFINDESAKHYLMPLGALVIATWLIFLGPLLVFTPKLVAARRRARVRFGALSARMLDAYEREWVDRPRDATELLDAQAPSAVTDQGSNLKDAHAMGITLIQKRVAVGFALAVALPMVPLALHEASFVELLQMAFHALVR